ncbi:hypothetical protein HHL19_08615 [Streptomyces sp. R302]|uniref:hypothetical protein n=1 Tax=unclassified Streptomyces TaxID=2593676 RepID=UPI00145EB55A|nr:MULTISPECIES: hypothetical protein [unclassified Streptomyces]NML52891.1 hypothetical protein [Streptomyces sp. R301]NML78726.1 hypothetical protein [Streptomyces sp. R302]
MKHRFPRLLFVTLCGLAPAVLGHFLDWSAWLWGFMSMVTASGSLLLVMTVLSSGHTPADPYEPGEPEPPAVPTERPYQEARVVDAALSSATNGYDFLFSATVWWRPVPDHAGQADSASSALAVSSVVSRALEVVRHEEPGRASFARYLLEGQLGILLPDLSGRVKAMAADVTLTLAPADRERLQKLNDLRKDEEIWEYERQHERNKRRYLGDDVLKSAGSAVVWWLARHENEIEKAVDMIGPLAQVAAAANDEEVPELFRHLLVPPVGARNEATVGGPLWDGDGHGGGVFDREEEVGVSDRLRLLLTEAGLKPDMDGYTVLAHRVMRFLKTEGLDEAADEIRRAFGLGPDESPEDEPSGEGNTAGPWPPRSPSPEGPPFTDPDVAPGASTFTPRTAGGSANAEDRGRGRWETGEEDTPSPHFWDLSHSPHRPAEPGPWDEDDENRI